jgi:sortase (surface protein transpeptidase)
MDSLDQKLNQSIVAESVLSKDACIEGGNAYLMGHSEPTSSLNKNKTGSYVFSRINELINGDTINLSNSDGVSCSYEVYETFNVVTDYDNNIDLKTFDNLINPQMVDKGTLTIQTCQKGSTTVRLIVRARLVSFS